MTEARIQILLEKWNKATYVNPENRSSTFEQDRLKSIQDLVMAFVEFYNMNDSKPYTLFLSQRLLAR